MQHNSPKDPNDPLYLTQSLLIISFCIFFNLLLTRGLSLHHRLFHLHCDPHSVACPAAVPSDPLTHAPHVHLTFCLYFCFLHHHP